MANKIGTASERYTLEWWKEWEAIADGLNWNTENMMRAASEMIEASREHGWKEAAPGASFLCHLFQLKDALEETWREIEELEREFPEYYDRMYDDIEEESEVEG